MATLSEIAAKNPSLPGRAKLQEIITNGETLSERKIFSPDDGMNPRYIQDPSIAPMIETVPNNPAPELKKP